MSLDIKNEETLLAGSRAARLTGETMTGAKTVALRDRLEREQRLRNAVALARELHATGQRCAARMGPGPSVDHGELPYGRTRTAEVIIDTSAVCVRRGDANRRGRACGNRSRSVKTRISS